MTSDATLHAVVIDGRPSHGAKALDPGSYFTSTGHAHHPIASGAQGCVIYVRTKETYES